MHAPSPFERRPLLTHCRYDRRADRLTVVADVGPAAVDDLRVLAGPRLVRLEVEDDRATTSRAFLPPSDDCRFTDDRRAVLHNGVLEVTVGVARRGT